MEPIIRTLQTERLSSRLRILVEKVCKPSRSSPKLERWRHRGKAERDRAVSNTPLERFRPARPQPLAASITPRSPAHTWSVSFLQRADRAFTQSERGR
jgi:hypothetical protein